MEQLYVALARVAGEVKQDGIVIEFKGLVLKMLGLLGNTQGPGTRVAVNPTGLGTSSHLQEV